jgi:hypothetical protein
MLSIEMKPATILRCTPHALHETENRMREFRSGASALFPLRGCRLHRLCVKSQLA